MRVLGYFDRAYIINLPTRTDRRRQMRRMLKRVDLRLELGFIEFFPAIRPATAGEFPSVGARGCFLSHLKVLQRAWEDGLANVLVMEDDLEIDSDFSAAPEPVLDVLRTEAWGLVYFGHVVQETSLPKATPLLRRYEGPIQTTHFYAVNRPLLPRLIAFLEAVLERPAGHRDGGPMHVDGAYSTFRQQNPEVVTMIASPSLGWQRSSRGDVAPKWFDRIPVLTTFLELARSIRGRSLRR